MQNCRAKKLSSVIAVLCLCAGLIPGCTSTTPDCSKPDVFCVGLVTDGGRVDDQAFNQAAWQGVEQARAEGIADWTAAIQTVDPRDYEENIRVFGEAGYRVIVTVGDGMGDATRDMAGQYPTVYFIGVDQYTPQGKEVLPNLAGLVFPEGQIGFLAGTLAALMTQTGHVGAVLGSDALPPMKRYGDGFQAGVDSISSKLNLTISYHNDVSLDKTLDDPKWGASTAGSLLAGQADVIFGVGGTTGSNALLAAAKQGAYVIGAETDEYYTLPDAAPQMLTSVLKQIAPGTERLIELAKEARLQAGSFPAGDYLGQVGLAPYHDLESAVPQEVKVHLAELNWALLSGGIQLGSPAPIQSTLSP